MSLLCPTPAGTHNHNQVNAVNNVVSCLTQSYSIGSEPTNFHELNHSREWARLPLKHNSIHIKLEENMPR